MEALGLGKMQRWLGLADSRGRNCSTHVCYLLLFLLHCPLQLLVSNFSQTQKTEENTSLLFTKYLIDVLRKCICKYIGKGCQCEQDKVLLQNYKQVETFLIDDAWETCNSQDIETFEDTTFTVFSRRCMNKLILWQCSVNLLGGTVCTPCEMSVTG